MSTDINDPTHTFVRDLVRLGEIYGKVQKFEYKDRQEFYKLYRTFVNDLKPSLDHIYKDFHYVKECFGGIEAVKEKMEMIKRAYELMWEVANDPGLVREAKGLEEQFKVKHDDIDARLAAKIKELDKLYKPLINAAENSEKIGKDDLDIIVS